MDGKDKGSRGPRVLENKLSSRGLLVTVITIEYLFTLSGGIPTKGLRWKDSRGLGQRFLPVTELETELVRGNLYRLISSYLSTEFDTDKVKRSQTPSVSYP